ncbi:MAG: ferrous iron transport protein A [Ruminococcaceae bacterium]|nr:ferrous iron transport protein A [Oscillospiraceae bacterium]
MNRETCTLAALSVGESGVVCALDTDDAMRRRLWDMGMVEGTSVQCLFRAPSGDPTAYAVRGAVLALRRRDAAAVTLCREAVTG